MGRGCRHVLRVKDLWVGFGGSVVLRGVSFSVASSYHVVLGPSGSGKSTLLRAIAGLVEPASGSVSICGDDVTGLPPWERGVALVHQMPGLLPHMSILENVALAARVRTGLSGAEARQAAMELLRELGLEGVAARRPGEVSGGQLQRAAIAAALAASPRLLLLDEPLSHLDRYTAERLRRLFRRVAERHSVSVVHVTHDLDEALSLGDEATIIAAGRVIVSGPLEELYRCPGSKEAAELLGHGIVEGGLLGLDKGLYSVSPEAVELRPGGRWVVAGVERERGRVLVEARLGSYRLYSYMGWRGIRLNPGDPVEPVLVDEPCPLGQD